MEHICYNCFQEGLDARGVCTLCGYDGGANRERFPQALPQGSILLGRYILGRVLGQGGFGITYLAQDYQTKGLVAIKEFFPDTMATRTGRCTVTPYSGERGENFVYGREGFLEEAKTMAAFLGNPNIVQVHGYFEENNTAYFVMEYLQGCNLQEYIKAHGGRLSWTEALQLLLPVMDALSQMHAQGIIHRDVTPDNIFVTQEGTVKLLDFGAARYSLGTVSRSLDVILKHGFAPKEQYQRHGRQGPYTDVYSTAATMYYAITGARPDDSIERADEDTLPLPTTLGARITPAQEDVLLKGLAVQPGDRYQTIAAFREALTTAQPEREKPHPPKKPTQSEIKPGWKLPGWLLPGAAAVLALAALGVTLGRALGSNNSGSSTAYKTVAPAQGPQDKGGLPVMEITLAQTHVMAVAEDLFRVSFSDRADQPFWGQTEYPRSAVETVCFRSSLDEVSSDAWDVSQAQDGSVLAWMDGSELNVAADGNIAPNPDASFLFFHFENLKQIDFGNCFDTSQVQSMYCMFYNCESMEHLDLSDFDTSCVTDMSGMFWGCDALKTLNVSSFDTSNVIDMSNMFGYLKGLTSLDVSNFETSSVVNMGAMFADCSNLVTLNLSNFDTIEATDITDMFARCDALENLQCSDYRILQQYADK